MQNTDTQWRAGTGGVYGLDLTPIIMMAESLSVDRDAIFYRKVRTYELEALRILDGTSKKELCTPEKKAFCQFQYGKNIDWVCKKCKEMNHA